MINLPVFLRASGGVVFFHTTTETCEFCHEIGLRLGLHGHFGGLSKLAEMVRKAVSKRLLTVLNEVTLSC